jgi:hypothetical protein
MSGTPDRFAHQVKATRGTVDEPGDHDATSWLGATMHYRVYSPPPWTAPTKPMRSSPRLSPYASLDAKPVASRACTATWNAIRSQRDGGQAPNDAGAGAGFTGFIRFELNPD